MRTQPYRRPQPDELRPARPSTWLAPAGEGTPLSPRPHGTLLDAIGGVAVVPALVDELYQRVLQDPLVAPFFAGVSVSGVMQHQSSFLQHVLGGIGVYDGKSMHEAHRHLPIADRHFDRVLQHLREALRSLGVPEPLVIGALDRLATLRQEIVSVQEGEPDARTL